MKYLDTNGDEIKVGDTLVHARFPSTEWTVIEGTEGLRIQGRIHGGTTSFQLDSGPGINLSSTAFRLKK